MTKDQIIYRDTITGQTVTAEYAKAHPDTTVRETRKAGKWRRRAEAAEAKLDAVRELHRPVGRFGYCATCAYAIYPCPTVRALDGTEEADR